MKGAEEAAKGFWEGSELGLLLANIPELSAPKEGVGAFPKVGGAREGAGKAGAEPPAEPKAGAEPKGASAERHSDIRARSRETNSEAEHSPRVDDLKGAEPKVELLLLLLLRPTREKRHWTKGLA